MAKIVRHPQIGADTLLNSIESEEVSTGKIIPFSALVKVDESRKCQVLNRPVHGTDHFLVSFALDRMHEFHMMSGARLSPNRR